MAKLFLLYESANGYAVFEVISEDTTISSKHYENVSFQQFGRFSQFVKLVSFKAFESSQIALKNIKAVCENSVTDDLHVFLDITLPKIKKNKFGNDLFQLGVYELQFGSTIKNKMNISCVCNTMAIELLRGIRKHFMLYFKEFSDLDLNRAQIGLSHAYSRDKLKFNVKKMDNMIIQAINVIEILDKDINFFVMKVKEWYGWHYPELIQIIDENQKYLRIVLVIKERKNVTYDKLEALVEITEDKHSALKIIEVAKISIGQDINQNDMINIEELTKRVLSLAEFRQKLHHYLDKKMQTIAPNLSALVGELVGARLISQAGSLVNLAKYSASTLQILGAEKALFRAIKKNGNTPKYGLIFNSSFIGKARLRNKGRISRFVANKCSIAARIDAFMEGFTTNAFGIKMKEQVQGRLLFYDEGVAPKKNIAVMREVLRTLETNANNN
jgi:nucleolar protein 56